MKKRFFRVLCLGLAMFVVSIFATSSPVLAQTITISTNSGSADTVVSVTGSGFTANAAFQTYFAYGTTYQTTVSTGTVSPTGTLTTNFNVPAVPAGTYIIRVQTSTNNAVASFTVTSAITINVYSVVVGNQVSISGTGFSAGRTVVIRFDNTQVAMSSTNNFGMFSTIFTVPDTYAGSHTITATDSVYTKTTTLTVIQSMTISPTSCSVGAIMTVNGTGFSAGRTVSIKFDNTQVATTSTNNVGKFSTTFNIPETYVGFHTITVTDGIYTKAATFSVVQSMTISPTSGPVGTTVTIYGAGFNASRSMRITYDGSNIATVPSTVTTNYAGSFTTKFTVPAGPARTVEIAASDGKNAASAYYKLTAIVELIPTTGKVGTPVTIKGSGFNASRQITITFNDGQVSQVSTDTLGNFTTIFDVPAATGGQHPVIANDGVRSVSATFAVANNMVVTPGSGNVGMPVNVTGSGFRSNRTVNIYFDSTLVATAYSDISGSFSVTFNAVAGTGGVHTISSNDGSYIASSSFIIQPGIAISQTSGKMGAQVNVTGTGFDASRMLTIGLGTTQIGSTTTDTKGSFSSSFTVPQLDIGSYNLNASDGTHTASIPFTITTSFSISPSNGYVGSPVIVKGSGFNGLVTIKYDDDIVATAMVTPEGSFSTTFIVPVSVHGFHTITASDTSGSLHTTYSMESVPPATPIIISPQGISREKARPTFIWQGVTDASGVTYNLQIASDANFSTILLEKEGLTATQYSVSSTEKLKSTDKETPYYWRVQAVDLASNQSPWSTPSSFYVSFMADWLKYTLIALGSLIGALLIFWLGMIFGRRGWEKETS